MNQNKLGDNSKTRVDLFPRPNSLMYNISHEDIKIRKKTIGRFKLINNFLVPLYRLRLLPLLGIGRLLLLVYTKGHKSGQQRIIPLEFIRIDRKIYIFSSGGQKSHWFRNLLANPNKVKVQVGFRSFNVNFDVLEGSEAEQVMRTYVKKRGRFAGSLIGWDPNEDDHETADFSSLLKIIKIIRISKRIA
jgi:deazaflavin-dependent oxidoreductase (nitroreductase family)